MVKLPSACPMEMSRRCASAPFPVDCGSHSCACVCMPLKVLTCPGLPLAVMGTQRRAWQGATQVSPAVCVHSCLCLASAAHRECQTSAGWVAPPPAAVVQGATRELRTLQGFLAANSRADPGAVLTCGFDLWFFGRFVCPFLCSHICASCLPALQDFITIKLLQKPFCWWEKTAERKAGVWSQTVSAFMRPAVLKT